MGGKGSRGLAVDRMLRQPLEVLQGGLVDLDEVLPGVRVDGDTGDAGGLSAVLVTWVGKGKHWAKMLLTYSLVVGNTKGTGEEHGLSEFGEEE
jgi:hypothetical protein